jgi:hypothetical protein
MKIIKESVNKTSNKLILDENLLSPLVEDLSYYKDKVSELLSSELVDTVQETTLDGKDAFEVVANDGKVLYLVPSTLSQVDVYDKQGNELDTNVFWKYIVDEFIQTSDAGFIYKLVGGDCAGTYTIDELKNLPCFDGRYGDDQSEVRNKGGFTHRKELDNQPELNGYLGPMFDGWDKNHTAVIRYETQEVYDALSEGVLNEAPANVDKMDANAKDAKEKSDASGRDSAEATEARFTQILDKLDKIRDYKQFVNALKQLKPQQKILFIKCFGKIGDTCKPTVNRNATISTKALFPTQNEIDLDNSLSRGLSGDCSHFFKSPVQLGPNPVLTYNGKYILDGHHRWSQVAVFNPEATLKCIDFKYKQGTVLDVLKDVQAGTLATLGKVPSGKAGSNIYENNEESLKKYIEQNISDACWQSIVKAGKAQDKTGVIQYLVTNAMKINRPANGAPDRTEMPQTTDKVINRLEKGITDMSKYSGKSEFGQNQKVANEDYKILSEATPVTLNDLELNNPSSLDLRRVVKRNIDDAERDRLEKERAEKVAEIKEKYKDLLNGLEQVESVEDKLEDLHYELVPSSGKADTVAGELIRAIMRIMYRDWNDGDKFFMGYGLETCGGSANYLADMGFNGEVFGIVEDALRYADDDDAYTRAITDLGGSIINYIIENPETLVELNDTDSRDYRYDEIEEAQPKYDYDFGLPREVEKYLDADYVSYVDIQNGLESDLEANNIMFDSVECVGGSYVYIYGLTYDDYQRVEDFELYDASWWSDYISEWESEYGDPDEDDDDDTDESLVKHRGKKLKESVEQQDRILALAKYLEVEPQDITNIYDNCYETPRGEYLVVTEDEANELAIQDIKNLYDDIGLDSFTPDFRDWIIENALDQEWFRDVVVEGYESYVKDIDYEDGRLEDELLDAGIITQEDVKNGYDKEDAMSKYVDYLVGSVDDAVTYCGDNYGWDWVSGAATEHNLIDLDVVCEQAIQLDGIANFLGRYDGKEHQLEGDLFAYRTN